MLNKSNIPYLSRGWSVVTGCSEIGCTADCWARAMAHRFKKNFDPSFHPDRLADPLKARKPEVLGVSFFGDWCDKGITRGQRFEILAVAEKNEQRDEPHTLIFLTKQAEEQEATLKEWRDCSAAFPLEHCWFGVSVTCQRDADERIPHLLRTPAAHRWVSAEPLVGAIDFGGIGGWLDSNRWCDFGPDVDSKEYPSLDLVIAGGESGPNARPMDLEWVRSIRDQCNAAEVSFALKQMSGLRPVQKPELDGVMHWAIPWLSVR